MRRQLRQNARLLVAIGFLVIVALGSGGYILSQQRLRSPLDERCTVQAEFAASVGLVPGLGQPVNVAGVKVGQVAGVELENGRAVVALEMDPEELPQVFSDAHARLVPRTPLKDLQVELDPGRRRDKPLAEGGRIPVARTSPPLDSDELTRALDADTRDLFSVLVGEGARGMRGRGGDLRALLRTLEPTAEQIASLTGALKRRRGALRGLVHELSLLAHAAGRSDQRLGRLVETGNATLGALAAEERALRTSVRDLPATLRATRRTLARLRTFTAEVRPALEELRPAARRLAPALDGLAPLAQAGPGIVRTQLRPFVREAGPLAKELTPAARDLSAVTPDLVTSFLALNYVVNELAFNPPGDDEGYLYWLAWFTNNSASFLSTQDAHGPSWRGLLLLSCDSISGQPGLETLADALTGLLPICQDGG